MAANPLTDLDLEAFCRRRLLTLTSWEKEMLFRLDDAVLRVWSEQAPKAKSKAKDGPAEIPASNVPAIRALFRGIAAVKRAHPPKQPAPRAPG